MQAIPALFKKAGFWVLVITFLLLAWVYWNAWDNQVTGFAHDDGVYLITAQALAMGEGPKLLHLPLQPMQVKYPLLFPLVLSLGWLINPSFPDNLPLFHGLIVLIDMLALGMTFTYLYHVRKLSFGWSWVLTILVGLNISFFYFATLPMSEPLFLLLSLATLAWVEKAAHKARWQFLVPTIILSALAFHTRTIGFTLIAAIAVWLLSQKRWKDFWFYSGITGLCTVVPWFLWGQLHSMERLPDWATPLKYIYGGYQSEFRIHSSVFEGIYGAGSGWFSIPILGLKALLESIWLILFPPLEQLLRPLELLSKLIQLGLLGIYVLLGIQAIKQKSFSVAGFYLLFYGLIIVLWMYPNQMVRFLVVLLPLLWLYLHQAVRQITNHRLLNGALAALLLLLLLPTKPAFEAVYRFKTQHTLEVSGRYETLWSDYQATYAFIRQTLPPNTVVGSCWEPPSYLYSGHPSFPLFTSALKLEKGQITEASFENLLSSFEHLNVNYVLDEPFLLSQIAQAPHNLVLAYLFQKHPGRFQAIYTSPHGHITLYRVRY